MALTAIISSSHIMAQDNDFTSMAQPLDFLAVKDIRFETSGVYEYGQLKHWTEDDLHAGLQSFGLTMFNYKEIQKDAPIPDNPSLIFEIFDMEGNRVARNEIGLKNTFARIRFSKKFSVTQSAGMTMLRGRQYKIKAEISPGLFDYESEVILTDEPCMHISNTEGTIDSIPYPEFFLSSGYPYEASDFSGEKYLHWEVASVKSPATMISEGTEIFELKSDTPTLAAIAKLVLKPEILEPGEYQFTLTSDYAPANYSFITTVNDVLNPEITFDKSIYTVGDNKEATIQVDMNYGFPYIGKDSSYDKPTVEVSAGLLGDETTVAYSDDAWADSKMQCAAELKVPTDKITDEIVKKYKGKIPLSLSISFNGITKLQTTLELPFKEETDSGITNINADKLNNKVKYYNILGIEVNETYPGLIITSDGQKIIR